MVWDFTLRDCMGKPTNAFYDPEKARDGGGYWQYKGFCTYAIYEKRSIASPYVEHLMTFCVEDGSCGWFGTRRHANIGAEQGGEWNFSWGRRVRGDFLLRLIDGTKVKDSASYRRLKLLERSSNYLIA